VIFLAEAMVKRYQGVFGEELIIEIETGCDFARILHMG
jgi:hypothetical protein